MDSLLESAKTYIEVLRNCSSDKVANWKAEDLERAVNWAEYFKRVQGRIQKKTTLIGKFDAQLKELGLQVGMRFGRQELSSEFLGESLHYLITTLLENPALPPEIKRLIQQKHANSNQLRHAEKVSNCQTLLTTLAAIHNKLTANLPLHASPIQRGDPLLVADALILQDEVEWMISQQMHTSVHRSPHPLPQSVHTKLEELVKQEHGLEVILLSTISQSSPTGSTTSAPQIILQWLQEVLSICHTTPQVPSTNTAHLVTQHTATDIHSPRDETNAGVAERFWALPPHLLAGISAQSVDFFRIYFQLLASRVNLLQAEVAQEFENGKDTEQTKHTYLGRLGNEVLPYFRALLATNPNVRDVMVALVTSQVEETAARLLAVSMNIVSSSATSESTAIKYPVNLWRKVLGN